MAHSDLQTRYEQWCRTRAEYSKREETGNFATPNEWQWNDDEAVELLGEAMSALRATCAMLSTQDQVVKALDELIGTLTTHADTMRELLHDMEYAGVHDCLKDPERVTRAIAAYDAAIKEA